VANEDNGWIRCRIPRRRSAELVPSRRARMVEELTVAKRFQCRASDGRRISSNPPYSFDLGQSKTQFNEVLREKPYENVILDQGGTIRSTPSPVTDCGRRGRRFQFQRRFSVATIGSPTAIRNDCRAGSSGVVRPSPVDPTRSARTYGCTFGACCRTPVFFSPRSLTCRWTRGGGVTYGARIYPDRFVDQVVAGITIGENILGLCGRGGIEGQTRCRWIDPRRRRAPVPTRPRAIPIAQGGTRAGGKKQVS